MRVVVTGAGMIGLCSAMLLAKDGHEVTVVERDPAEPPDPQLAWDKWERRGINQFRLAHAFLSRFRSIIESELPELATSLVDAGACRYNIVANIPDEMKGGSRPDDAIFEVITGRRTFTESATAWTCEETKGVTVRRGTAVEGLLTGAPSTLEVPHATGVRLAGGEQIEADLVVDATGRRSPLPSWLRDVGADPIEEELEDCGFTYYGRHYRSADGELPVMIGPLKQDYGSISVLTLPADNGTWSVTLIASSKDADLRKVRDPETFVNVVRTLPLAAHWLDGEAIDEGVASMSKIEDRIRNFAPGGRPVATGVLPVADSWACTNPSLGRGVSIGAMHALALRDLLRTDAIEDPGALALAWTTATALTVEPWYRSTLFYDRHRLDQVHAIMDGETYQTDDEDWHQLEKMQAATTADGDVLRAFVSNAMVLRLPEEILADESLRARIDELGSAAAEEPQLGPTRHELLAAAGA